MYVSVQHAAHRLGVSPVTIRRWTASGFLPCKRTPGGHRRISTDDLDELAQSIGRGDQLAARIARERELETMVSTAIALSSRLELGDLLAEVARHVTRVLDCDFCTILEYDAPGRSVRILADYDRDGRRFPAIGPLKLKDFPLTQRVLDEQKPQVVNVDDPGGDPAETAYLRHEGYKCELMVPLVYQGRSIGYLEATDVQRTRRYSRQELRLAQGIASHAAVALVNARVFAASRESDRQLARLRHTLADLKRSLSQGGHADSLPAALKELAENVCQSFEAVSCVVTVAGHSAGTAGRSTATHGKVHVIVATDPAGLTDLTLTVTLPQRQRQPVSDLLDLVAATASAQVRPLLP